MQDKFTRDGFFRCVTIVSACSAISFGCWQHSWTAGVFLFSFFMALFTIGLAVRFR